MNDELTNINRFANYLASLTDSEDYRQFIKHEKKNLRSDFIESGWFQHKGKPFTTKEILYIWFNSEIFHSDPKKTSIFLEWLEIFADDTAKSMLFMAVYDCILVIRNINWSAMELAKNHMYLRMPNTYKARPCQEKKGF